MNPFTDDLRTLVFMHTSNTNVPEIIAALKAEIAILQATQQTDAMPGAK